MSNGRDDRTKIDFTVADRVMLQSIHDKMDNVLNIKDKVNRNSIWITVFLWLSGGGTATAAMAKIMGLW